VLRRIIRLPLLLLALVAMSLALATPASATSTHRDHGKTVHLDGGSTTLAVDRGTLGVLVENKVSVTPIRGASAKGRSFTFPITGGRVDAATVAGTIEHSGGLQFAAGGKKLRVQDFVIDTRKGVLTARVSGTKTRVALLKLNLGDADIDRSSGKVVVGNVRATLTADAAAALNKTFGVSLFKRGLTIGVAKVTARF
jgi:hypothetical protein